MGLNKRLSQLVACITLQRNFIIQSTACEGRRRASEGSSTFLFFVANFKKRVREKTFPPPVVFLTNNAPQNLLCVSPHYARPLKRKKWKLVPGKGGWGGGGKAAKGVWPFAGMEFSLQQRKIVSSLSWNNKSDILFHYDELKMRKIVHLSSLAKIKTVIICLL